MSGGAYVVALVGQAVDKGYDDKEFGGCVAE